MTMIRAVSVLDDATEACVTETIDCAIAVHREIGPGFMEPIYHNALCVEMSSRGIPFEREVPFVVHYQSKAVGLYRIDLVVRACVVVELKAVKSLEPIHQAQVIAYLKASKIRIGLLMNFARPTLREGLRRIIL